MSSLKLKRYILEKDNIITPKKNKYEEKNFKHKCNFCNRDSYVSYLKLQSRKKSF